jgi:hypothetical protein
MKGLWLTPIPPAFRQKAVEALDRGDWSGFLMPAPRGEHLSLVARNQVAFRERGLYEPALFHALKITGVNNHGWSNTLKALLSAADRDRFRQEGAPLPGAGPFTLYRGVAGRVDQQCVRGVSWTLSFETAKWFAMRFRLPRPEVYRVVVAAEDILAYVNDSRKEEEMFVCLKDDDKVELVWTKEHGMEVNDGQSLSTQAKAR